MLGAYENEEIAGQPVDCLHHLLPRRVSPQPIRAGRTLSQPLCTETVQSIEKSMQAVSLQLLDMNNLGCYSRWHVSRDDVCESVTPNLLAELASLGCCED